MDDSKNFGEVFVSVSPPSLNTYGVFLKTPPPPITVFYKRSNR